MVHQVSFKDIFPMTRRTPTLKYPPHLNTAKLSNRPLIHGPSAFILDLNYIIILPLKTAKTLGDEL
jgi:hypothetical protein